MPAEPATGPRPAFDYSAAPWPVRANLAAENRSAWQRLGRPGTWWNGRERVALAAEVRAAQLCPACAERKAALSPFAVDTEHSRAAGPGADPLLPAAAVDAVHRLVTDPGRLTRRWFDGLTTAGLSPEQYVEIVGLVTTVLSIDCLHEGLGLPVEALPEPEAGEPARRRPEGLTDMGAYVPMLPASKARGPEADLYGGAPFTGNVIAAMSLVPDCVRQLMKLSNAYYLPPDKVMDFSLRGETLSRAQIELVAGRVSALNECFY